MPTENRSTPLVSRMESALAEFLRGKMKRLRNSYTRAFDAGWQARDAVQPAEQHQGEPVAYSITDRSGDVTLLLPDDERLAHRRGHGFTDAIPLYTHADPGEVERLRDALDECDGDRWKLRTERDTLRAELAGTTAESHRRRDCCAELIEERDTLRAQLAELKEAFNESQEEVVKRGKALAERDAQLREALPMLLDDAPGNPDVPLQKLRSLLSASAEPSVPVVSMPEGYCLMPRQLTAENGAKTLLLGEFKLNVVRECPECRDLEEPVEGCDVCDGEGEFAQSHTIPWDQIKFIYSVAVKGLALKPGATSKTT